MSTKQEMQPNEPNQTSEKNSVNPSNSPIQTKKSSTGFRITAAQLKAIAPGIEARKLDVFPMYINELSGVYEIDTPKRMAAFLAQAAHESGEFNKLRENMNYSAKRLLQVFPKYFQEGRMVEAYQNNPEKIGSRVYANRMGNGDEASGDGFKYRGGGIFQTTGKNNYGFLSKHLYEDSKVLLVNPEFITTPSVAIASAMYYWQSNKLNRFADKDDFKGLTKAINGGLNGYEDRVSYWRIAREEFGIS